MPDLMVQVDGQTVPLKGCFWVRFDNAGCATGSAHAVSGLTTLATAEQAQQDLVPYKRDRDRETKQGVRYELLTKQQWREQAMPCFTGDCQHAAAVAA